MTKILGIETSCDETGIAIVENGLKIISHITKTQKIHKKFGGVVPNLSSREHMKIIDTITEQTLINANLSIKNIDAIAVVNGPGLIGSLMVGIMYAKGLALKNNIPLIAINHILSHFYANVLKYEEIEYPVISLIVSGGHSSLFIIQNDFSIKSIGKTLDDAAGEAFDKCAKMLNLDYPGGPVIESLSKNGNRKFYNFPRAKTKNYDFSFSGLKTSVLYYLKDKTEEFINEHISDITASIQEAIADQLIIKLKKASNDFNIKNIAIAGGVSANSRLREKIENTFNTGYNLYIPDKQYCTDNGVVVAGMSYNLFKNHKFSSMNMNVFSR